MSLKETAPSEIYRRYTTQYVPDVIQDRRSQQSKKGKEKREDFISEMIRNDKE